jgi:ABC-type nitrate/sulfonate/bicarbonate transport system permease component
MKRSAGILGRFVLDNWGFLLLLVLWEGWIAIGHLNAIVMPHSWSAVADILAAPLDYAANIAWTLTIAITGLLIGVAIGTGIAVTSWCARIASGFLSIAALILSSVPVVAFIPILGRLLGYDTQSVLTIVAIICFFPSFVFTVSGLRALPPGGADLFATLGASRLALLRYIALPAALPNWMTALRLSAPTSILAAMSAEYLMATPGLGTMIHDAMAEFDSDRAIGGSLVAATLSLLCFGLASKAEAAIRSRWS